MNFDQYIEFMKIDVDSMYSYGEVATIMRKDRRTIRRWCDIGIKTRNHGIQVLRHFDRGGEVAIPGRCLIDFLQVTQGWKSEDI